MQPLEQLQPPDSRLAAFAEHRHHHPVSSTEVLHEKDLLLFDGEVLESDDPVLESDDAVLESDDAVLDFDGETLDSDGTALERCVVSGASQPLNLPCCCRYGRHECPKHSALLRLVESHFHDRNGEGEA